MDIPTYDIEFTKAGAVFDSQQVDAMLEDISHCTDLWVMSHGWNNDMAEARALYEMLLGNITRLLDAKLVQGVGARSFGAIRVFWPSKKFADDELIPGGGAASATGENDKALWDLLERMKDDPPRLGEKAINPIRDENLSAAQASIPKLQDDPKAREEFVFRLRAILNASEAHADDGSLEFFQRDPEELFENLKEPVHAPAATGGGGATSVHAGGAAGLGDLLSGVKAAARRLANFTTYYDMKQRAGTVGRTGLAPVLLRARDRNANLRLHLIGHSFGGRLVTAAAHALPPGTSKVTLALLQAAYSHNGLAENYDGKNDGAFRALLSEKRISGPIIITHTKNDRAVGIAYPLASRISRDQASALGDENDPYGGMGRNGAQHTPEALNHAIVLQAIGRPYAFESAKVYNLKGDEFIADHGDVAGPQVAYAVLSLAASVN